MVCRVRPRRSTDFVMLSVSATVRNDLPRRQRRRGAVRRHRRQPPRDRDRAARSRWAGTVAGSRRRLRVGADLELGRVAVLRLTSGTRRARSVRPPPRRSPPRRRSMSLSTGKSSKISSGMERCLRGRAEKPVCRFSRTVSSGKISRPWGTKPMPVRARSCTFISVNCLPE